MGVRNEDLGQETPFWEVVTLEVGRYLTRHWKCLSANLEVDLWIGG